MQSSINHVVVLVVFFSFFFSHTSTKLGHIFPQPLLAILPDRLLERRHTKTDICIGLCGGKLAYCFGFLSLLLSFLSVTQFFNLYLLREGFLIVFPLSLSLSCSFFFPSLRNIVLHIHDFTHIHTWEPQSTSTDSTEQIHLSGFLGLHALFEAVVV